MMIFNSYVKLPEDRFILGHLHKTHPQLSIRKPPVRNKIIAIIPFFDNLHFFYKIIPPLLVML